jgi:hypothetical protein
MANPKISHRPRCLRNSRFCGTLTLTTSLQIFFLWLFFNFKNVKHELQFNHQRKVPVQLKHTLMNWLLTLVTQKRAITMSWLWRNANNKFPPKLITLMTSSALLAATSFEAWTAMLLASTAYTYTQLGILKWRLYTGMSTGILRTGILRTGTPYTQLGILKPAPSWEYLRILSGLWIRIDLIRIQHFRSIRIRIRIQL